MKTEITVHRTSFLHFLKIFFISFFFRGVTSYIEGVPIKRRPPPIGSTGSVTKPSNRIIVLLSIHNNPLLERSSNKRVVDWLVKLG